ncbi:carbohydrate-binding module family 20 domain-containing protein [Streptococcus iniae]
MVNHFETSPGEQLYLLGDVFELGANDSKNAIGPIFNDTASIAKYPNWFYDVNLPINKDIHIKLVKKNSNGEISWTSPETYTIRQTLKHKRLPLKINWSSVIKLSTIREDKGNLWKERQ